MVPINVFERRYFTNTGIYVHVENSGHHEELFVCDVTLWYVQIQKGKGAVTDTLSSDFICIVQHVPTLNRSHHLRTTRNFYRVVWKWSLYTSFYNAWLRILVKALMCCITRIQSLQNVSVNDCFYSFFPPSVKNSLGQTYGVSCNTKYFTIFRNKGK